MNSTDYKKLKQSFRYWVLGKAENEPEYYKVLNALRIAEKYHTGFRKDGVTPELNHQITICSYLRTIHKYLIDPVKIFVVALLHDTAEDYAESITEIHTEFPDEFEYIIRISKVRNGIKISYEQYFGEMKECYVCSVVKLADRISNISTMVCVFSYEKQTEYLKDLDNWFFPMLKHAKRKFAQQEPAYENMKIVLTIQKDTILKVREDLKV